jgi:hypothetical protein
MASIQEIKATYDRGVVARGIMEFRIVRRVAKALLEAGLQVSVNNGEDITVRRSRDLGEIMGAVMTVDEERLIVRDADTNRRGMVYLVYGNDGWDVISDYSVWLESILAPVIAYCNTLG